MSAEVDEVKLSAKAAKASGSQVVVEGEAVAADPAALQKLLAAAEVSVPPPVSFPGLGAQH